MCDSFPKTDWNGLSEGEREKILRIERRKGEPLTMQGLYYVAGTLKRKREGGFLDFPEFDELAARTKPVVKDVRPGEPQERLTITRSDGTKIWLGLLLPVQSEFSRKQESSP